MRSIRPPGDKSISHRALILASLADGASRIRGLLSAEDVAATAAALGALGAEITQTRRARAEDAGRGEVRVHGPAPFGSPAEPLDCGNSGTTARLLAGLAVGAGVGATLVGDPSLRRRPMERVVYPLQAMGGRVRYLEESGRLPIRIDPRATGGLRPLRHRSRVASAQVKSALLLAGLAADTRVEVREPGRSRDHTERMLQAMGAPIEFGPHGEGAFASLRPREGVRLAPLDFTVPGDLSAAAFLIAAALLSGRALRVENVGLNPTRTGFLEAIEEMGAEVRATVTAEEAGEPVGDLEVRPGELRAFAIQEVRVPRLLDEVPALAVLAARAEGTSRLSGAAELRVKESDRLAILADNLARVGVRCRERPDGLEIEGTSALLEGEIRTGGDHRIAMAFGALTASGRARLTLDDRDCVAVSFPGFWERLAEAVG